MRPLIAITPDLDGPEGAPTEAEYRVRCNYAEAVARAGGTPAIVTFVGDPVELMGSFDGVLVSGGAPGVSVTPGRTEFELALIHAALEAGRPLLGICNGMQLIGRALGATLIENLATEIPGALDHIPEPVPARPAHAVRLTSGGRLAGLAEGLDVHVNSLHRQAIGGDGAFTVAAEAPDGVAEAIEGLGPSFCLGVQWHPEYGLGALDRAIFMAFVTACAEARAVRTAA